MWRAVFTILLGMWLIFSAFAWPNHQPLEACIIAAGAGFAIFGALSTKFAWARGAVVALTVLLFLALVLFKPANTFTFWNNALTALVIFVLSLVERPHRVVDTSDRRQAHA
jgi:hypothetical protein